MNSIGIVNRCGREIQGRKQPETKNGVSGLKIIPMLQKKSIPFCSAIHGNGIDPGFTATPKPDQQSAAVLKGEGEMASPDP